MLIGEHQLSWMTSASSDKHRASRIDEKVRLAVTVFLQGCVCMHPPNKTRRSGADKNGRG